MKFSLLAWSVCIFGIAAGGISRADVAAEQEARYRRLPAGTDVSPPRAIEGMALGLGRSNPSGIAEHVPAPDGPEFDKSMRVITRRVPPSESGFQAAARTHTDVKKDDLLLAVFWIRAAGVSESAEGSFVFETLADPPRRSVHYRFECEREWRRVFIPFAAASDAPAGEAIMRFHLGYGPQVLEIGGLRVANYGAAVAFSDMPYTPLAYKGRSPDAPWRAQANAAIEKERKAQFTITVRNSRGKAMPWTSVRIRQLQHTFGFATSVSPAALMEESDAGDGYREHTLASFNEVELNSGLDWGTPPEAQQTTLDAAEWLRDYDVHVRCQSLFAAAGELPAELAALRSERAELKRRILEHVREKVGRAKGSVSEWTIPIALASESELGTALLADILRAAREADSKARLLIHAGNVLADGVEPADQTAVLQAIRALIATKAPVHGVALGSHFRERLLSPERVRETLDRFAELRLPITVTDHGIETWDEQAQADYTRDFLTMVFSHPATVACSIGGLWAGQHAVPKAAFFTQDWRERPQFQAWHDLVHRKWESNATVSTNGKGIAKYKAFLGYYAIEVRGYGEPKTVYAKLGKAGRWLVIYLPASKK